MLMRKPRRANRRALALAIAVAAAASVVSVVALGAASGHAAPSLYAYPANPLYLPAAAAESGGDHALAAELKTVTQTPSGIWAAGQPGDIAMVRTVTLAAGQAHAVPVIVAYNLPDRDACGKLSGTAAPTAAGYQAVDRPAGHRHRHQPRHRHRGA